MVILNWPPPLPCPLIQVGQPGKGRNYESVGKFRTSRPEIYKNSYANIPKGFRESTCGGVLF